MADISIRNATERVNLTKRTIMQYKVMMQMHNATCGWKYCGILYATSIVSMPYNIQQLTCIATADFMILLNQWTVTSPRHTSTVFDWVMGHEHAFISSIYIQCRKVYNDFVESRHVHIPIYVCARIHDSDVVGADKHSVYLINFIHQAVDKYNETNTGK